MFKLSKKKVIDFVALYNKAENFVEFIPAIKRNRRRKKIIKFLKFAGSGILIFIALILLLGASSIFNLYRAASSALEGKDNLVQSINFIKERNFDKAFLYSEKGKADFLRSDSYLRIGRENIFINHLPGMEIELNNFYSLIKSAEVLSQAMGQTAAIGSEVEKAVGGKIQFKFSELEPTQKENVLKLIYESGPELNGLKANLDLAYFNLEEINYKWLPFPIKGKVLQFKSELDEERMLLNKLMPIAQIIPVIAGYPSQNAFLLMLQNNDELRPTGGFLGTYGILEMKNGDIVRLDTHDIYHLDMPVKDRINVEPPEPLKKYLVEKWYMRDANWSPDWPTSARQILWFYEKEDSMLTGKDDINNFKGEFSGVIAITPNLVSDILALTGPIFINGEEYNKDNFHDILQYEVERDYIKTGKTSWQRKEIIGEISKELKTKFLNQGFESWTGVADLFKKKILEKDLLVYLSDAQLEDEVKGLGWAGDIKETSGDYLMVVDANLGSFKTDASMAKSINYAVEQSGNKLIAKLKVNYAHRGSFDWRTTTYRTYTRVYVPEGSKLIKAEVKSGFMKEENKTEVTSDLGKTNFGTFMEIDPGKVGNLYFEYELPASIFKENQNNYSFYAQRQPGSEVENLTVDLSFGNKVKSYNPAGFSVDKINGKRVKWETDFNSDKTFSVNF